MLAGFIPRLGGVARSAGVVISFTLMVSLHNAIKLNKFANHNRPGAFAPPLQGGEFAYACRFLFPALEGWHEVPGWLFLLA